MHTKLLTCTFSFLSLLLHPTITSSLDTSFTITNLTHILTSTVAPHIHNGSITFTFTISPTASSSHYCEQTFITPYDPAAAGGPFACNDAWQDMLYYWREDLSAADGMVEFNVWYAYLDCRYVMCS
ncbi:hypothetical protein B0J12DRAFT_668287 [Macrophomina phaseolina]|uniref:AA1-like domain-containing protein n=1 Tax=Macrophomina phaseolina TaxID=35725 RepID=A0ABQ8GA01_9PEZI|nr:hypothetical protein B0J12DRAFT_668287 [Macrophomina phaseolina]